MDTKNYIKKIIEQNLPLAKKIRKINNVQGSAEDAYSFIISSLQILYPDISEQELIDSITDGDKDEQLDSIVIRNGYVDIYDFKHSEGFGENEIRLFVESIDNLIFNTDGDISKANKLVQKKIVEARRAIDDGDSVRVRVVRGGKPNRYPEVNRVLEKLEYHSISEKKFLSGKDLISHELNLESAPITYEWKIKVKKNSTKDDSGNFIIKEKGEITSLICRISLLQLVKLYFSFEKPEIIFEANVRGLQNSKKVSTQIIDSLENTTKAKNFYKLHNGLTIVGDKIIKRTRNEFIISNPQIVNGCQTVTTISKFFKNHQEAKQLDYGSVVCKIFAAEKTEVETICLASNTQVAINPWDLRTNDEVQIVIEAFLKKSGIQYSRKATKINKNNLLTLRNLGQWMCATKLDKPAFAKNSMSKIFDNNNGSASIYHKLFNSKTNLEEVERIVRIGIYINGKHRSISKKKGNYEIPANLHFLASFYYLQEKEWTMDVKYEKVNIIIQRVIKIMKKRLGEDVTHVAIFTKHEETWKEIKKRLSKL